MKFLGGGALLEEASQFLLSGFMFADVSDAPSFLVLQPRHRIPVRMGASPLELKVTIKLPLKLL